MSAMTIRDVPPDLQAFLRDDALANHRSLNKQVIVALDQYRLSRAGTAPRRPSRDEKRARIERIQREIAAMQVLDARSADEILDYDAAGLPA